MCARFSLLLFSIGASGQTVAACSPVIFNSTGGAGVTGAVLGCVDSERRRGAELGFCVTATGFNGYTGNAIAGLSPQTVSTKATATCVEGKAPESPP